MYVLTSSKYYSVWTRFTNNLTGTSKYYSVWIRFIHQNFGQMDSSSKYYSVWTRFTLEGVHPMGVSLLTLPNTIAFGHALHDCDNHLYTVPENLRKSGKRKNTPNFLFHSCFTEGSFVINDKFMTRASLSTSVSCLRQTGGDIL